MIKLEVTFEKVGEFVARRVCVLVSESLANDGIRFDAWFYSWMPARTRILVVHHA